jgi:molybdenum cofactor cytidylyltransferase
MELIRALRISRSTSLAFVGAGGKTTALFQLARQLVDSVPAGERKTVFVTATTHLGRWQLDQADHFITVRSAQDLDCFEEGIPGGVILLTGPEISNERVSGLEDASLFRLHALAESHKVPLLIEADGARQRPLKSPAAHEPAIPEFVNTVLVVAGLSALGERLTDEWVHRPEIFASQCGLKIGQRISPQALSRVLIHPEGGVKNMPAGARRLVLLNQADTPELQALAHGMVGELLTAFSAVVVAALAPPPDERDEMKIGAVFAVHEPVAGIILAAGASTRLGEPKPALLWRNRPLVWHVVQTATDAALSPVIMVSGAYTPIIRLALGERPVHIVHNADWEEGQSSSVRAGLHALVDEVGAVIFFLVDQPQIPVSLVRKLVETHASTRASIVAPMVDGQRGNPVLFDRDTFDELLELTGDSGGRQLFSRYPVTWVPWHDARPLLDIDTLEDYQRLLDMEP